VDWRKLRCWHEITTRSGAAALPGTSLSALVAVASVQDCCPLVGKETKRMMLAGFLVLNTIVFFVCPALPQAQSLGPRDTFAAAKLSPKEMREIITGVEPSAYDTPDSWSNELRAKRVDLGGSPGIVLQGTKLLCGATGNCQLFVFRKVNDKWVSLFGEDQAPTAEFFQLGPSVTKGIKDLTVVTNSSAESTQRVTYKFDGQFYRSLVLQ
jgi:hypothetical protein